MDAAGSAYVSRTDEDGSQVDIPSSPEETDAKRRKLRKGTHSCWECKRRKVRCQYASETHTACVGCRRRGTTCISQEFPETMIAEEEDLGPEPSAAVSRRFGQMGDRIVRVEALIEQLTKQVENQRGAAEAPEQRQSQGILTPGSSNSEMSRQIALTALSPESVAVDQVAVEQAESLALSTQWVTLRSEPSTSGVLKIISQALYAAMPTPRDAELLSQAGAQVMPQFIRLTLSLPYSAVGHSDKVSAKYLCDMPGPDTHPVLLAKYMLTFAFHLQYAHRDHFEQLQELSQDRNTLMTRLMDTVTGLVTSNDKMLGTVEGLECVMLQGVYEANCGNMRRAWMTFRRAMLIAQLMGINRSTCPPLKVISPDTKFDPSAMWLRILILDRWHSLMLGLPQGSLDTSIASEAKLAADTPLGQLERLHCVLSSRVLARNEQSQSNSDDWDTTKAIDADLQKAAKTLPKKWWLLPKLDKIAYDSAELFWESQRLISQLCHFNLLNRLHLPYMLRFSPDKQYEYSKMTCVNASREMLSRYVMYRSFNCITGCCRPVDFYAFVASMTLLLAHLDSHKRGDGNMLGHQRWSDRGTIEQVLYNMDSMGRLNQDALSIKSASLLRQLMVIEDEAADGGMYSTHAISSSDIPDSLPDDNNVLRMVIPYFGTIKIARETGISRENQPADSLPVTGEPMVPNMNTSDSLALPTTFLAPHNIRVLDPLSMNLNAGSSILEAVNQHPLQSAATTTNHADASQQTHPFEPQFPSEITQVLNEHYQYPALTAGLEDWAFQGVDLAFFENLMKGTEISASLGDVPSGDAMASWPLPETS